MEEGGEPAGRFAPFPLPPPHPPTLAYVPPFRPIDILVASFSRRDGFFRQAVTETHPLTPRFGTFSKTQSLDIDLEHEANILPRYGT